MRAGRRPPVALLGGILALATATVAPARAGADEPASAPVSAPVSVPASASAPVSAPVSVPVSAPAPAPASAPASDSPGPKPISTGRKVLATAAAIVPGALLHGSGHFVAGQRTTAYRLLAMEGIGFGLAAGSLAILAATGASRRFSAPLVGTTVVGAGLFFVSALADLYGVLAPEGGSGWPRLDAPYVETQLGARYVYDPTFAYRAFIVQSVDLRLGPFRLMPSAWFAADDVNARLRALASYRVTGPKPGTKERPRDGSFLDIEAAATNQSYAEGFAVTTLEASIHGRLDADRLAPTLRGSFFELGWGGAVSLHRYRGMNGETEGNTLLLARFAYGLYLGRPPSPWGEAMVYYDHRHDDYAAGLKIKGLGSGVAGHFGAKGTLFFAPEWGVLLDASVGSAYVVGASAIYRYGGSQ